VAGLPKGERTVLRRGGEPLTVSDRARLQLARATLGDPPLLLLNHIDSDLGPEGCETLAAILRSYPGVVIIASDHPEPLVPQHKVWDLRRHTSRDLPHSVGRRPENQPAAATRLDERPQNLPAKFQA
jgi:ABC-type protease/lipase transport system fused ATPase/permease subunit